MLTAVLKLCYRQVTQDILLKYVTNNFEVQLQFTTTPKILNGIKPQSKQICPRTKVYYVDLLM